MNEPSNQSTKLTQQEISEGWTINDEYQTSAFIAGYFPIKVRFSLDGDLVLFRRPSDLPSGKPFEVMEVNCAE